MSDRTNSLSPDRRDFLLAVGAGLASASTGFGNTERNTNMAAQPDKIDVLKKYSTSLIESAIYLLKGTHDGIALTRPAILPRTNVTETLVGYAATSVFSTDPDDERGRRDTSDYWKYVFAQPGPKIAVSVDASKVPGSGSSWGQQNAHIHKGLGCRGVITNGGVRDIDVFRDLGLSIFAGSLTAAHGNPHFIDFGKTVELNGARINPGDIVCSDQHGSIIVPKEMLPDIEQAAAETMRRVGLVAEYAKRSDFTPEGLMEVTAKLRPATPWKPKR